MEGYLQMPQNIVIDILATLELDNPLYLLIEGHKSNGTRHIRALTIQHLHPETHPALRAKDLSKLP